nr:hypothetical protein [Rhodocaloribacter litoris]
MPLHPLDLLILAAYLLATVGLGWGLCEDITHPVLEREIVVDGRVYHTIKEVKNGLGPPPLKTPEGWLHLAHGVRGTAAGLRYVLYLFMTALADTRLHVATTTLDQPLDYVKPPDPLRSAACVDVRRDLIRRNLERLNHR